MESDDGDFLSTSSLVSDDLNNSFKNS